MNGVAEGTPQAMAGSLGTNVDEKFILCDAPDRSYYLDGSIDSVRISDVALDPSAFLPPPN